MDIDKWKHLLASVEAVINTTVTSGPDVPVKLLELVTEAAMSVCPTYATKLTYVETSEAWVHGDSSDVIVTDTTPTATPHIRTLVSGPQM